MSPTGWRRVDEVEQTGSTNADLMARAGAGEDIAGVVLIAEHQTAGRGRQGRTWSATPGAQIAMSVGVSAVDVPVASWGWLSLATGVAVIDVVSGLGVPAGLKWPNDVLVGGAKLAGILAEVARPAIVVGLGLNVTAAPDGVDGAIALVDAGVAAPDRQDLIAGLLRALDTRIAQWRAADPRLAADYRAGSLTIGSRVRAQLPGGRDVLGDATGIDEQGRLRIDADGQTVVVSAGDVVHLR